MGMHFDNFFKTQGLLSKHDVAITQSRIVTIVSHVLSAYIVILQDVVNLHQKLPKI